MGAAVSCAPSGLLAGVEVEDASVLKLAGLDVDLARKSRNAGEGTAVWRL